MHPRLALTLVSATAVCVVALVAILLLGGHKTSDAATTPTADSPLLGGQIDIPAHNFHLADQDGHQASLSEYRGRVVILSFMYSTCQNTCPLEAQQIRGALDDLGQAVPALTISVDPSQDTPLNAQRFLYKESLTGRMRFLLGTRRELEPIWKAYGIQPQSNSSKQSDHSAYVMLIDRRGRLRDGFPDSQLTPEALAHDIRVLEAQAA